MNDMQIRDTLSTVIEQMHPVATYANGSAIFEELDACRYALTGRIASTQNHPSRRVRIIDDPVESVTLEDGRERPMLQMVKPDWLYDENGDKRGD